MESKKDYELVLGHGENAARYDLTKDEFRELYNNLNRAIIIATDGILKGKRIK